jgi:putative membrane protein
MRKLVLAAALVALATPLYAQSQAPTTPAPKGPAATTQPTGTHAAVSAATKKFVDNAAITDMFEIKAGQLAQQKAPDSAYKDFAQMTIEDHTKTSDELKGMAPKFGIELPQQLDKTHQAAIDKLNAQSGAAFERAYKIDQVRGHREAIAMFERYARSGDNPDLKKWASQTLPTLHKHLQHAEALPKPAPVTTGSGTRK